MATNAARPSRPAALLQHCRYFQQAANGLDLPDGETPIVVANYGSSEGRNSSTPLAEAIMILRSRAGDERSIAEWCTQICRATTSLCLRCAVQLGDGRWPVRLDPMTGQERDLAGRASWFALPSGKCLS